MSKMSLIPAFDMQNNEKCKTCMLTKITRQPFKDVVRESKVLDLIHNDLCDFHAKPSLGNKKYVVTFIDDASRYCYIYLLHSKDEALDKFKIYKQQVELHNNELIKVLRVDRGGKYYDPVYFESTGIIHQTTTPYTPQQNGVAERKNRTLKEMVNSMLSYSGLSEGFWGEAMLTACYILNRTPNKRSKNTPYKLWCKKVPNLSYLKVWGCRAVVRLTEPKRKTLGERGIYCIFIRYVEHSKAYRFYVLESNDSVSVNTVIESRDAIFDEERFTSIPRPRDMIINLPARVLLKLKMFLVVQVLYLNLGKALELEKLSLLDLIFNFIWLKEQGMRLYVNINIVLILKMIQRLSVKLWLLGMYIFGNRQFMMRLILSCITIFGY